MAHLFLRYPFFESLLNQVKRQSLTDVEAIGENDVEAENGEERQNGHHCDALAAPLSTVEVRVPLHDGCDSGLVFALPQLLQRFPHVETQEPGRTAPGNQVRGRIRREL